MSAGLEIRTFAGRSEYEQMVDYFLNGEDAFLQGMGVDRSRLPTRDAWITAALRDHEQPNETKDRAYLAWVIDGEVIGHSSINKIKLGDSAFIHLHMWTRAHRRGGLGTRLFAMSAVRFARDFSLKRLYCEPYALNPAPNRVVLKCQFHFVKRYTTIPGPLNFEQEVNQYVREFGNERDVPNTYDDPAYAADYAQLEWTGTYHLVRRELPGILRDHVSGHRAIDFGCGTGRSTRLLRELGFTVTGVDIAPTMIERARQIEPSGNYVLLAEGELERLPPGTVDLVLAAFPFDNTPAAKKPAILRTLARLLAPDGRIVNIVSTPELYTHEWTSFSTRDFPENRNARDGDLVRSVTTQFRNGKPADDFLCSDAGYREVYRRAGLEVAASYKPLGRDDDGIAWVSERAVAPWAIHVLRAVRPAGDMR